MERDASRPDVERLRRTGGTAESGRSPWPVAVQVADELHTSECVQRARGCAHDLADRRGCDEECADRFESAVYEVCANAVVHAGGGCYGMWCNTGELVCEVVDAGPGMSEPFPGSGPPKISSAGGYGLAVARQMCEHVEIESRPGWTSVRLHVALG